MPTYVCLYNFTDQGMRNIQDTTKRAKAFTALANSRGVNIREVFWTLGPYDMVAICEAPDDIVGTALALSLGKLGNVRVMSLRAFSLSEMDEILLKVT
jgi:uncharacterized protein with GYD domain